MVSLIKEYCMAKYLNVFSSFMTVGPDEALKTVTYHYSYIHCRSWFSSYLNLFIPNIFNHLLSNKFISIKYIDIQHTEILFLIKMKVNIYDFLIDTIFA